MSNILIELTEIKDLTPSERHVADYILEHYREACHMGVVELGEKSFTSAATVKRLCRRLGVKSYTEFRMRLSAARSGLARGTLLEDVHVGRYDTVSEVLEKVSRKNAAAILEYGQLVDTQMMSQVVERMAAAKRIDFYGVGSAYFAALSARQWCLRLKIPTAVLGDRSSILLAARNSGNDTLAFLIGSSGEEAAMLKAARELVRCGAVTVALTRTPDDLLAHVCRYDLRLDVDGELSGIAVLNLNEALFTALINTDYDRYTKRLEDARVDGWNEAE